MSDFGICLDPAFKEKRESLTCDLPEQHSQEAAKVCKPEPNVFGQDHFVASDLKENKLSLNQLHKQISLAAFGGFSPKAARGFGGGSLIGYNPLSLLSGCNKKDSYEEEMADIRKNDPDKHRSIAWGYHQTRKFKQAQKEFELYLARDPNNVNALGGLGSTYLALGDLNRSEETLKKALEIDPNDIGSNTTLGMVYLQKGNLDEVEKYFKKVLEIIPNDKKVIYQLGLLYEKHNRLEEAEGMYDLALKADPSDEMVRKLLAKINYRIGSNRLDNDERELGKKALEKAASLDPNYVEPRVLLAGYYILDVEYVEAEKVLNEILKVGTDEIVLELVRGLLADVYVRSGNIKHLEFTEKELKNSIKKYPNIGEFHYQLGWVYQKKGGLEAADEEFKRALELDPSLRDKYPELKDPKFQP